MKRLFILVVVLLAACSLQQTSPASKNEYTSDVLKTIITSKPAERPVAAEPKISNCNMTDGKVVVVYDNEQKESFKPYCLEKDEDAFKSFIQVYYCEGLIVKSKLIRCTGNKTCLKGACV